MTAKEKVLAVWPDAFAFRWAGWWRIYSGVLPRLNDFNCVSNGETEEAAWQNAAESLPAQPEQEGK
jgi:hypothetical protein